VGELNELSLTGEASPIGTTRGASMDCIGVAKSPNPRSLSGGFANTTDGIMNIAVNATPWLNCLEVTINRR